MPAISMFYGIVIYIYWEKGERHNLPHLHAVYNDCEAVLSIPNGKMLSGKLPRRQMKLVQAWIILHEDELLANWNLAQENQPLFKIDPLK
ncbi:MAG: DUF4160 domain-containing protein [Thermoguttaceae bacterium]